TRPVIFSACTAAGKETSNFVSAAPVCPANAMAAATNTPAINILRQTNALDFIHPKNSIAYSLENAPPLCLARRWYSQHCALATRHGASTPYVYDTRPQTVGRLAPLLALKIYKGRGTGGDL